MATLTFSYIFDVFYRHLSKNIPLSGPEKEFVLPFFLDVSEPLSLLQEPFGAGSSPILSAPS